MAGVRRDVSLIRPPEVNPWMRSLISVEGFSAVVRDLIMFTGATLHGRLNTTPIYALFASTQATGISHGEISIAHDDGDHTQRTIISTTIYT